MLTYHPAYDAYHCAFRCVKITNIVRVLEISKLRLLDYFLCFPAEVANIQLPQEHADIRRVARSLKNDYRGPVTPSRMFADMAPIQREAFRMLSASAVFDQASFELGMIQRTELPLGTC